MKTNYCFIVWFYFFTSIASAQTLKVINAETNESVPFFHLFDSGKSKILMGGPDGTLSVADILENFSDSLFISHIGYETLRFSITQLDINKSEIQFRLRPLDFELDQVSAGVLDEVELFARFQTKLKNKLGSNSWLVRVHSLDVVNGPSQVIEQYGLLGFGGLVERKGKFGEFEKSNYFLLSEYARRTKTAERNGWFTSKDLIGILLNEILWSIQSSKMNKVEILDSDREKSTFFISYKLKDLQLNIKISEEAELLELSWENSISLNLADKVKFESGEIRFFPDSELLVPISLHVNFERLDSQTKHQFFMLSSFIPSPLDYRAFLSENYKLEDYYALMGQLANYDDFNSISPFFESSKAKFQARKMLKFAGNPIDDSKLWEDEGAIEYIVRQNPGVDKEKVNEFYKYKGQLLDELKKLGLRW